MELESIGSHVIWLKSSHLQKVFSYYIWLEVRFLWFLNKFNILQTMTTFLTTRSMFPYIYLKDMLPKDRFHIIWRYEINYHFVMQSMIKCSEKRRKKRKNIVSSKENCLKW